MEEWLERAALEAKPTTFSGYRRPAKKANDAFGRCRMQDLTPLMVEHLYLQDDALRLSAKAVRDVHASLR